MAEEQKTTTEQIVRLAPFQESYLEDIFKSAKDLTGSGTQMPYSAQQLAGLSPAQQQAITGAMGGVGAYQPYLQAGSEALGQGIGAVGTGLGTIGTALGQLPEAQAGLREQQQLLRDSSSGFMEAQQGLRGAQAMTAGADYGFDPTSYQQYMDPYMNDVIQQQYQDIQRQGDIQKQGANAQAVGSGAFGGSRQGIQQAEINRNVLDQQARTGSQLRSAGYQNAQQQAQAAFENSRARQAQQAQLTGQLGQIGSQAGLQYGQQMGQLGLAGQELTGNLAMNYGQQGLQGAQMMGDLGTRQAALGELGQNMLTKDAELMYTLGGRQQAQQQAGLEATRSNQMAQLYEPYQRLGFLSDIYSKTPTTQQTISQSTSPSVSPFQQYLGLGIAGLSAGAGAAKAGLFG